MANEEKTIEGEEERIEGQPRIGKKINIRGEGSSRKIISAEQKDLTWVSCEEAQVCEKRKEAKEGFGI